MMGVSMIGGCQLHASAWGHGRVGQRGNSIETLRAACTLPRFVVSHIKAETGKRRALMMKIGHQFHFARNLRRVIATHHSQIKAGAVARSVITRVYFA